MLISVNEKILFLNVFFISVSFIFVIQIKLDVHFYFC